MTNWEKWLNELLNTLETPHDKREFMCDVILECIDCPMYDYEQCYGEEAYKWLESEVEE